MKCVGCGCVESKVVDSRQTEDGYSIRRRRECDNCGHRFTTYEKIDMLPLMVIKKDKRREPFDSSKLRAGVIKACEKRPVSLEAIDRLIASVEARCFSRYEQEIRSQDIGEMIMEGLKQIDEVAYVRFASVYRQFRDIQSFMDELSKLMTENTGNSDGSPIS